MTLSSILFQPITARLFPIAFFPALCILTIPLNKCQVSDENLGKYLHFNQSKTFLFEKSFSFFFFFFFEKKLLFERKIR